MDRGFRCYCAYPGRLDIICEGFLHAFCYIHVAAKIGCRSSSSSVWLGMALQQLTSDTVKSQSWRAHILAYIRDGSHGIVSGHDVHRTQVTECPILRAVMTYIWQQAVTM